MVLNRGGGCFQQVLLSAVADNSHITYLRVMTITNTTMLEHNVYSDIVINSIIV